MPHLHVWLSAFISRALKRRNKCHTRLRYPPAVYSSEDTHPSPLLEHAGKQSDIELDTPDTGDVLKYKLYLLTGVERRARGLRNWGYLIYHL